MNFNKPNDNYTFVVPEVLNLAKLLMIGGHEVEILSKCDISQEKILKPTHRILINSRFYKKGDNLDDRVEKEREEVQEIFKNDGVKNIHIITDWKIIKKNDDFLKDIKFELWTQTPKVPHYAEYEKIFLMDEKLSKFPVDQKKSSIIYIGNSRGGSRDNDLKEFLVNSGVNYELFGNFDKFNCKGKIKYIESQNKIEKNKYGLCLTEKLYVDIQHRTPRIWEYILAKTLAFVDYKYPIEENLVDNFQIVNNGEELKDKIDYLEKNNDAYLTLLENQTLKMDKKYLDDVYMLNKIEELLK